MSLDIKAVKNLEVQLESADLRQGPCNISRGKYLNLHQDLMGYSCSRAPRLQPLFMETDHVLGGVQGCG